MGHEGELGEKPTEDVSVLLKAGWAWHGYGTAEPTVKKQNCMHGRRE